MPTDINHAVINHYFNVLNGDFDDHLENGVDFPCKHVFIRCDFSTEHIQSLTKTPVIELSFNGYFVDCENVQVSVDGYGEMSRVIAVNNTGYIFVGCSTFGSLKDAVHAIEDKYRYMPLLSKPYIGGLRMTYAKAKERFKW